MVSLRLSGGEGEERLLPTPFLAESPSLQGYTPSRIEDRGSSIHEQWRSSCCAKTFRVLRLACSATLGLLWNNGAVSMAMAALVFAMSSFSVKMLHGHISVFQIVATRSTASLLLTIVVGSSSSQAEGYTLIGARQNWPFLASRGLFGTAAMTLYYVAIRMLPLGDAVTIFFSNAVVTTMAAVCLGLDNFSWFMALGCVACTGGVILVAEPPFIFDRGEAWDARRLGGVLFGMYSAFCAAGAFLSIRALGKAERPITMTLWFHATASLSAILPLLIGTPSHPVLPNAAEWAWLANVAWTSFVGQLLLSRGFQLLPPSYAAAINLSQVVHANLLSVLFLHESLTWHSLFGAVCMAAGVILTQMGKAAGAEADEAQARTLSVASVGIGEHVPSAPRAMPTETSLGHQSLTVRVDLQSTSMELAKSA